MEFGHNIPPITAQRLGPGVSRSFRGFEALGISPGCVALGDASGRESLGDAGDARYTLTPAKPHPAPFTPETVIEVTLTALSLTS